MSGPVSGSINAGDPRWREWTADVVVLPKEGVNDPEGEAIRGGLASLGHDAVRRVRAGRFIRLTVSAPDAETAARSVATMCDQLLANPVIETYRVTVGEADATPTPASGGGR